MSADQLEADAGAARACASHSGETILCELVPSASASTSRQATSRPIGARPQFMHGNSRSFGTNCSARAMVTLKTFPVTSLVADRIVERRSCAERPHRFEYALTRHGTAVLPVLDTWHDLGQRMKAARAAE